MYITMWEPSSEGIDEQCKGEYKEFNDINISTTTVIITTNLEINLEWLFYILPVIDIDTSGSVIKVNKDFQDFVINLNPEYGTITMVQYKDKLNGFKIKKKKKKFFRNTLSIVMYVGKLITIKIPTKGKLQMTGCITEEHSELCIKHLWNILSQYPQDIGLNQLDTFSCIWPWESKSKDTIKKNKSGTLNTYILSNDSTTLKTTIRTVMTDIVFRLGYKVNRQNLDRFMNQSTEFNSLLETSFGYTGVNIKIPFELDMEKTFIKQLRCDENNVWECSYISYMDYVHTLPPKDQEKEISKKRRNTFLVFHSGTAIMSGMTIQYMRDIYDRFIDIIKKARPLIEEHIEAI